MNQRLDIYDIFPSGMTEYLSRYGWHFSKNMCEWAVSRMKAENKATGKKEEIKALSKEDVEVILTQAGVKLEKADYLESSIPDDTHLALFVKDYIDDPDGYDGLPFTRFYADCIGSCTPIMWEDML